MKIKDMSSVQLEEAAEALAGLVAKMDELDLEGWKAVDAVRRWGDTISREIDRRSMRNSEYRR